MTGKEVYYSGIGTKNISTIDIGFLSDGMYILALLRDGAYLYTGKVVVQH
jgi:hypothetical protein